MGKLGNLTKVTQRARGPARIYKPPCSLCPLHLLPGLLPALCLGGPPYELHQWAFWPFGYQLGSANKNLGRKWEEGQEAKGLVGFPGPAALWIATGPGLATSGNAPFPQPFTPQGRKGWPPCVTLPADFLHLAHNLSLNSLWFLLSRGPLYFPLGP